MKSLEEKKYWIWFSLIEKLGCIQKRKLLEIYTTPEEIYNLGEKELLKVGNIGKATIKSIMSSKKQELIQKHINYMKKNEIDIINVEDEEYPNSLKEIYDFPISLYVKGNSSILSEKNLSIIGCRECTDYGKSATKYFAYNLSKCGLNIVSGLARGIDSYAHWGCIFAQRESKEACKTIAVVGNGLDILYPRENYVLANEIIKNGGAIISEYPCGVKPDKMNFPARNRIISGISNGVLVVEAKEKSGTLITVDFALEQGRDVFVIPGNINSVNSVGTNGLIKYGAKMVTCFQEILNNEM
ncbi:MAG: DNA-protecting protein DprA [Clostridia bacterium]|nr:DNA-protecting protein DprA [Clostridia bacterium]